MALTFGITFDYLCPFARNANEQVVAGLRAGASWDVAFVPYSLVQGHVEEDQPDVWDLDDPEAESGILALEAGLIVRDQFPEQFWDVHLALFAARHDEGRDISDRQVVRDVLASQGVDTSAVFEHVDAGKGLDLLRSEHTRAVEDHDVWGVPTFIAGDRAVFIRLMDRPDGDDERAREQIERVVDLVANWPELHEFKQTDLPV